VDLIPGHPASGSSSVTIALTFRPSWSAARARTPVRIEAGLDGIGDATNAGFHDLISKDE
jgi:hypothetical protein